MKFRLRSLNDKLILATALIFLVGILLFSALSLGILSFLSQRDAEREANAHLAIVARAYQQQVAQQLQTLQQAARDATTLSLLAASSRATPTQAKGDLALVAFHYNLATTKLDLIAAHNRIVGQLEEGQNILGEDAALVHGLMSAAARGVSLFSVMPPDSKNAASSTAPGASWSMVFAVPVENAGSAGILLAEQPLDSAFVQSLVQGSTDLNVVICQGQQMVAANDHWQAVAQSLSQAQLCATRDPFLSSVAGQHILVVSRAVKVSPELSGSPALAAVDIEPVDQVNLVAGRSLLIFFAIGVFIFAGGVFFFTFVTRYFFLRPLRRLQASVRGLVPQDAALSTPLVMHSNDELGTLARSLNLLSASLSVHQSESLAMTKQMESLLSMSDALISTLNLEQLLAEFVSRLGSIMAVKDVSLLLYGREMLSPWAVAHWSDQVSQPQLAALAVPQRGLVTVHTDPNSDITMAVTTKLTAIAPPRLTSSSDKRQAVGSSPYGLRRPRIPRPALRDLDMNLARMAIQKQKIVYAEDIGPIYQERGETWSQMALEAGYRFVIAVPVLLQNQSIGAFILYDDKPHPVTSHDTFLLSTAAFQAAMAIQNALLFAEIKDKNAALERANHLKSQFLATVTHELRTPLHSIISYGGLLVEGFVEGELTSEQEEHIQFMVRRAEDLSRLVDDMLDLSKIEADRLEVKLEPLTLRPCLMEVVEQLKPLASNKGLYLTLEADEGLPMALADSYRLRQVALNLVSNALKFTEKGGVVIRCGRLAGYDMLRIAVQDSGIGISPAALGYIFEAFRQADGSTTRRFGGTGLGLTIARKLIELQGGEVAVESLVGAGSTFSFTLPVVPTAKTTLVTQSSALRTR
ncbi:MAG: ATP-binding protein [Ktedonobacteraceae bacterium]